MEYMLVIWGRTQLDFELWHLLLIYKKIQILSTWKTSTEVSDLTFQSTPTLYNAVFNPMHLQSL